jgi:hypothetical protein
MDNKASKKHDGTYVFSDDVVDEMQNLEATMVMDNADSEPLQDNQATVVLGKTYRLKVTGDDKP